MINLSPLQLYPNIGRAYEVIKAGFHDYVLIPPVLTPDDYPYCKADFDLILEFFSIEPRRGPQPQLFIEVVPFTWSLAQSRDTETLEDVNKRVEAAVKFSREHVITGPDNPGLTLLKTATERLSLSASEVGNILAVSKTVAALDLSDKIRVEHVAEAIQYNSIIDVALRRAYYQPRYSREHYAPAVTEEIDPLS